MTNHCTFKQCQALKEIGFDMEVRDFYNTKGKLEKNFNSYNWNTSDTQTSAPTRFEVLQWAREKKGMFAVVLPVDDWNSWRFSILGRDTMSPFYEMYASLDDDLEYPTYPEAESALIDKIIEILKEQKA